MPTTTRSASSVAAALERHAPAIDRGHRVFEMENDPMLFVQRAHEVTHLRPEHALHRPLLRRHHMNLDVAGAQRRRGLQSDEARTDDERAARTLGRLDDGAAIRERTQRMDMRLVGAGDRQPHRLSAGRQQQPVIGQVIAAGDHDFAGLRVDAEHFGVEPQFDAVLGVEARPNAAAANPRARCRRDNPWTGSVDRPAPPRHCSA